MSSLLISSKSDDYQESLKIERRSTNINVTCMDVTPCHIHLYAKSAAWWREVDARAYTRQTWTELRSASHCAVE